MDTADKIERCKRSFYRRFREHVETAEVSDDKRTARLKSYWKVADYDISGWRIRYLGSMRKI